MIYRTLTAMDLSKTYTDLKMHVTCLRIHYWSHLKCYAKKCRRHYYAML